MKQKVNYIEHHKSVNLKMSEDVKINVYHISLYNALFLMWNSSGFESVLSVSRNELMSVSRIGSANTYIKVLKELHEMGYIDYKPTHNFLIGSKISLYRFDTTTDITTDTTIDNTTDISSDTSSGSTNATLSKPIKPIKLNKPLKPIKPLKQKSEYDYELETLLFVFNQCFKTNYTSIETLKSNYSYWRKIYEPAQIEQSIINVSKDQFWKDKMSPTILFRQKNSNKEQVDYIGQFLNKKNNSTPLDQMHDAFQISLQTQLNKNKENG